MTSEANQEENKETKSILLGEYLKQKRLDKNFSLEKLSQKTKISVNILKSLEANDFDHLPSAAYIKGFVISYVKILGLPLHDGIEKMEYTYQTILGRPFPSLNHTKAMASASQNLKSIKSSSEMDEKKPSAHDMIENSDTIIDNTKSVLPIVILIVIISLFIGGYKIISSIIENEMTPVKTTDLGPKIESSSALVKKPSTTLSTNSTNSNSSSSTLSQAESTSLLKIAELGKPGEQSTTGIEAKEELVRNFPTIEFKKPNGKLFIQKSNATENDDLNILPQKIKDSMNSSLQNVYVRATDGDTWLSYKIDDKPIISIIINKDSDLYLQGNEVRIFLGNVNVTKIFYNNYLIDAPSKTGVKSLIFPEESNKNFLLPLFPKGKDDIQYTAEEYQKRMQLEEDEIKERNKRNQG